VIIDPNLDYAGSREQAGKEIDALVKKVSSARTAEGATVTRAGTGTHPYAFTELTGEVSRR